VCAVVVVRLRDEGCEQLCAGLILNERITTLSLNYCELDVNSGRLLADTVPNTCIMYVGRHIVASIRYDAIMQYLWCAQKLTYPTALYHKLKKYRQKLKTKNA